MKCYKKIFNEAVLKESYKDYGNLSKYYFDDSYSDYKYGNPAKAAENIYKDINIFLLNLEKNLELAEEFLSPAIKDATIKTLVENIKRMR